MKLIELEEVDSTNDYLKREYQNLPMQTCVTAKCQTKTQISEQDSTVCQTLVGISKCG